MSLTQSSVYELAGGDQAFFRLAHDFYSRVDTDPVVRDMFPQDLTGPEERLALFLIQYFGGPQTYSERRGHPRLRMRHLPFSIGTREKDAWLAHMLSAVEATITDETARGQMREYFERGALFMINRDEAP